MSFAVADTCLAKAPGIHRKCVNIVFKDFTKRILRDVKFNVEFKVNHQNKNVFKLYLLWKVQ